ncbi:MAG: hypothetical protein NUW01_09370 [Gemmatimonadaceae bacterium]|nr:hypothetical protein [Gemmatimonadaceae bacterium]
MAAKDKALVAARPPVTGAELETAEEFDHLAGLALHSLIDTTLQQSKPYAPLTGHVGILARALRSAAARIKQLEKVGD